MQVEGDVLASLFNIKAVQMEAQHTKLAVSASSQYATNAKYVEVNSGKHPRVHVFPGGCNYGPM